MKIFVRFDYTKIDILESVFLTSWVFILAGLVFASIILPYDTTLRNMDFDQAFDYFWLSFKIFIALILIYTIALFAIRGIARMIKKGKRNGQKS